EFLEIPSVDIQFKLFHQIKNDTAEGENKPGVVLEMQVKIDGQLIPDGGIPQSGHHSTNGPGADAGDHHIPERRPDAFVGIGVFIFGRDVLENKPGQEIGGDEEEGGKGYGVKGIPLKRKTAQHPDNGDVGEPEDPEVGPAFAAAHEIEPVNKGGEAKVNPAQQGDVRMGVDHIPEVGSNGCHKEHSEEDSEKAYKEKICEGYAGVLFQIDHDQKYKNFIKWADRIEEAVLKSKRQMKVHLPFYNWLQPLINSYTNRQL